MIEKIGKVELNLDFYPGEDSYTDGQIEDDLLRTVKDADPETYDRIILEKRSWPFLYHLSDIRQNIVRYLELTGTESVLEIGSGCGAITPYLARHAGSVTCIDLSKKRSMINAYRNRDCDNLKIIVGNYETVEQNLTETYDVITLIGVFEYGGYYFSGDTRYEDFLKSALRHLSPDGKLVIAIENRLGFKYFAGYREDHNGLLFSGIEGYPEQSKVQTFSRKEWQELLARCGVNHYRFYYPYPDYKFPIYLYSDEYQPKPEELHMQYQNYDRTRLVLFDDSRVLDSLVSNDLFRQFSNSFLIEIYGPECRKNTLQYAKFSNERDAEFAIKTMIRRSGTRQTVCKSALKDGTAHISSLDHKYDQLTGLYKESGLSFVKCGIADGRAEYPYIEGSSYADQITHALRSNDYAAAETLIQSFIRMAVPSDALSEFKATEQFTEVFGQVPDTLSLYSLPVTDVDLIMDNVIYSDHGWQVIDYEWTFDFPVPSEFLVYRILNYFAGRSTSWEGFQEHGIFERFGLTQELVSVFQWMEIRFQQYVTGNAIPMRSFYEAISPGTVDVQKRLSFKPEEVRFYYAENKGAFDQYNSQAMPLHEAKFTADFHLPERTCSLRIDPGERPCVVRIHALQAAGRNLTCHVNHGIPIDTDTYLTEGDPMILVEDDLSGIPDIHVELEIQPAEYAYEVLRSKKQEPAAQRSLFPWRRK